MRLLPTIAFSIVAYWMIGMYLSLASGTSLMNLVISCDSLNLSYLLCAFKCVDLGLESELKLLTESES